MKKLRTTTSDIKSIIDYLKLIFDKEISIHAFIKEDDEVINIPDAIMKSNLPIPQSSNIQIEVEFHNKALSNKYKASLERILKLLPKNSVSIDMKENTLTSLNIKGLGSISKMKKLQEKRH
jgi:hypothetical protein